jgi:uncharacterized membrane protein
VGADREPDAGDDPDDRGPAGVEPAGQEGAVVSARGERSGSAEARRPGTWRRDDELGFGRVWTFVDAVFAIALTLLVLDVRLPELEGDPDDIGVMWEALVDLQPQLTSFVVAFAVLAGYWRANHRFAGRVARIDSRLITWLLVYLAFVAFLPFPTSIVGEHEANPLAGVVFALSLAAVSGCETFVFMHARRADLLIERLTDTEYRWQVVGSLEPCLMFLVTIPLAFVHPTVMFVSWAIWAPTIGVALRRSYDRRVLREPADPAT